VKREGKPEMKSKKTLLVTAAAFVAAAGVLTHGNRCSRPGTCCPSILSMTVLAMEAAKPAGTNAPARAALPRLVDLGADKCIPCKMMAPVLKELTKEYQGRMAVEFIDVWKNPDAGKAYQINLIPTQIFFDAAGKELFRHEGFFSKKDILGKWKELGVDLKSEVRKRKSEGSSKPEGRGSKAEGE
jgi:thioredoxin 1